MRRGRLLIGEFIWRRGGIMIQIRYQRRRRRRRGGGGVLRARGRRFRLEFERVAVVFVLLELLQLFDVQKRVEIVLHVFDFVYVNGSVAVDDATAVVVAVMNGTVAVGRYANFVRIVVVRLNGIRAYRRAYVDVHVNVRRRWRRRIRRAREAAHALERRGVLIVGLLIFAHQTAYVVHLIATLRIVERIVRMRDVDVNEVGEKEAQKWYTRQFAVHVHVAYFAFVVACVEHDVGHAFELTLVALRYVLRPRLAQTKYRRRLERHHNGHQRVKRVKFV